MKAFVFSVGEPTTELCLWALRRQGLEPILIQDKTSLADKLQRIFAETDDDIVRLDADIIVNRNILEFIRAAQHDSCLWLQSQTFDWYRQDVGWSTPGYIKKELLPDLRKHAGRFKHAERPETEYTRIPELHEPRRFGSLAIVTGIHGWGQDEAAIARAEANKTRRNQIDRYDFELARRLV